MTEYLESFRGTVKAWECDHVEHFTVAYYFKSAAAAQLRLLHELGVHAFDEDFPATTHIYTRFLRELRKGDTYFINSGVIDVKPDALVLGHRIVNADSGEECTLIEMTLAGAAKTKPSIVDWAAPEKRAQATPVPSLSWAVTAADTVSAAPLDLQGGLSVEGIVHLFSDASVQSQMLIGMTPRYMRDNRIGFSTMEFRFTFHEPAPRPGDILEIRSQITSVGGTSLGFVHGLWNVCTGRLLATLTQAGVHLDLDKRRPASLPEMIRTKANDLMK